MKQDLQNKEAVGMVGVYRFTKAKVQSVEQWKLHDKIQSLMNEGKDCIKLIRQFNNMCQSESWVVPNIIPTVGRGLIANNLTNAVPTNSIKINYTSLGTGVTTPVNADTTLTFETYRKKVASETNANNIGYITAFYSATEVSGTFMEAGLFANGTTTTNSGVLFSHVLLNVGTGVVKTNTETLTIDWTLTIN